MSPAQLPRVMAVTTGDRIEPIPAGVISQLRAKDVDAAELERRARALAGRGPLAINVGGAAIDAVAVGADYLHLPEAAPVEDSRLPFGRSVHSPEAAARACSEGCAYLVAGPVWPTPGKVDGVGLAGLKAMIAAAGVTPVFAIGGILDLSRALATRAAGAHGVAGIRSFSGGFLEVLCATLDR